MTEKKALEIKKLLQEKLDEMIQEVVQKNGQMYLMISDDNDAYLSAALLNLYIKKRTSYTLPIGVFWKVPYGDKTQVFHMKKKNNNDAIPIVATNDLIAVDCAMEKGWIIDNHVSNFNWPETFNEKAINPNFYYDVRAKVRTKKYGGSTFLLLLALLDHEPFLEKHEKYTLMQQRLILQVDSAYMMKEYDAFKETWSYLLDTHSYFDDDAFKNCDMKTTNVMSEKLNIIKDENNDGKLTISSKNLSVYKENFPQLDFDFLFDARFDRYYELDKEIGNTNHKNKSMYNTNEKTLMNLVTIDKNTYILNTLKGYTGLKRVSDDY